MASSQPNAKVHHQATSIARTHGTLSPQKGGSGSVVVNGDSYQLTPVRKARKGRIGQTGAIQRDGGLGPRSWSFTVTDPVPLVVALLHWHILIGDWLLAPRTNLGIGG